MITPILLAFVAPLFLLIITLVIIFTIIGLKNPLLVRGSNFAFTRKCLGFTIITYATSLIITFNITYDDDYFGWAIAAQAFSWIGILLTLRGLFETLAHPDNKVKI